MKGLFSTLHSFLVLVFFLRPALRAVDVLLVEHLPPMCKVLRSVLALKTENTRAGLCPCALLIKLSSARIIWTCGKVIHVLKKYLKEHYNQNLICIKFDF